MGVAEAALNVPRTLTSCARASGNRKTHQRWRVLSVGMKPVESSAHLTASALFLLHSTLGISTYHALTSSVPEFRNASFSAPAYSFKVEK